MSNDQKPHEVPGKVNSCCCAARPGGGAISDGHVVSLGGRPKGPLWRSNGACFTDIAAGNRRRRTEVGGMQRRDHWSGQISRCLQRGLRLVATKNIDDTSAISALRKYIPDAPKDVFMLMFEV